MKTIEETQAAIDAIRAVCNQHGVVLIANCYSEGIYGEIEVADAAELDKFDKPRLTNKADIWSGKSIYTEGIGDAAA